MTSNASLSFDPVTIETHEGKTFPIDILIYSDADPIISADVWITYDPAKITPTTNGATDINAGTFFQITDAKVLSPGNMYLYAINQSPQQAGATNGKLATVYFKAKTSGTAELRFGCIPFQKQTSQIIKYDTELSNIINCSSTRNHSSQVRIAEGNVLGTSTQQIFNGWYISLAALLVIFAGILFFRYKKLTADLKD